MLHIFVKKQIFLKCLERELGTPFAHANSRISVESDRWGDFIGGETCTASPAVDFRRFSPSNLDLGIRSFIHLRLLCASSSVTKQYGNILNTRVLKLSISNTVHAQSKSARIMDMARV